MAEQSEQTQLTIFITGAGEGAGLAAATMAARAGYKVVGTTDLGSKGAYRIRRAGGIPVYPDLTRESAVYSALQMARADVIINAAPQALNGPPNHALDYDTLLPWLEASTDAITAAAGRADIKRIIHLSAVSIYGDTHHETVTEDASLDLSHALAKALFNAEEAVLDGGIPGYVLRTGYVVGTHEALAGIADTLRSGRSIPAGNKHASWAHEDDIASATMLLVEKTEDADTGTVYNIASEETMTTSEFIDVFGEMYGTGEPGRLSGFFYQFRTSELQRMLLDTETLVNTGKAQDELGWSPEGTIAGALDKMLLTWRSEEARVTVYHQEEESDSTGIVKA